MKLVLLTNFNCEFPDTFISFLEQQFPEFCCCTVNNKQDFNRWDMSVRSDKRITHAIKLYEKTYTCSLSGYFNICKIRDKEKGLITVNIDTYEESWELRNVSGTHKDSIHSQT